MKIYTKTGDKGETGVIGTRLPKSHQLIDAIGNCDELNAWIGLLKSLFDTEKIDIENLKIDFFNEIQSSIFTLGSVLAGAKLKNNFDDITASLEKMIDAWDLILPKLQNFILPGGSPIAAKIHVARSICRKTERSLVNLQGMENIKVLDTKSKEFLDAIKFINRLSDWLFVLARVVNKTFGVGEVKWVHVN